MAEAHPISATQSPRLQPEWLMLISVGELPNEADRALMVRDQEGYTLVWPSALFERMMQMATYPGKIVGLQKDDVTVTIGQSGSVAVERVGPSIYRHYEKRFENGLIRVTAKVINLDKKYGIIQAVVPLLREGGSK